MQAGKRGARQRGFTYLGVLFLIALLGIGLAGTGEAWSVISRRARERELLWVGNQYVRAIRAYYTQSPGVRQFPPTLDDLVEDRRFPEPRRHLRRLYPDPISREPFQVVFSGDGRVGGVRSPSDETPMKQDEFPPKYRDFKGMTKYSDWLFVADGLPGSPVRPGASSADAASNGAPFTPLIPANPSSPATAAPAATDSATPATAGAATGGTVTGETATGGTATGAATAPPAPAPVKPGPTISIRR